MSSALGSECRNKKCHMFIHVPGHRNELKQLAVSILHGRVQEFSVNALPISYSLI
jgi:hypothetical protein